MLNICPEMTRYAVARVLLFTLCFGCLMGARSSCGGDGAPNRSLCATDNQCGEGEYCNPATQRCEPGEVGNSNQQQVSDRVDCAAEGVSGYALDAEPYTTLQAVWEPQDVDIWTRMQIFFRSVAVTDIPRFESYGLGARLAPGQSWIEHRDHTPGFAQAPSGHRKSLLYLWQAADPQIIDEESPIRLEAFAPLFRPQGHLVAQVFEANVRTARRIGDLSGRPFDFAVLAGDLTDGSQLNELEWMLTALNGGVLNPDSGVDDDPVPGPTNDYNDPFCAQGLGSVDWYAAMGNHETLYNGGFGNVDDEVREASVGEDMYRHAVFPNGYRDGSTHHAELVTDRPTIADPGRLILNTEEVLQVLHDAGGDPAGHGLVQEDIDAGVGYFSLNPIDGKPIRLITLNTVDSDAPMGLGHKGSMDAIQFDWLQKELVAADALGELVVVLSHHGADDMGFLSAVSGEEFIGALAASKSVVLHLIGHGHKNHQQYRPAAEGGDDHGYWELMVASTLDFPMQTRIIELVDEDNGFLSVYVTNLGHNSPAESMASRARELAAAKLAFTAYSAPLSFPEIAMSLGGGEDVGPFSKDVTEFWEEDLRAQNLLLRVAIPDSLRQSLAQYEWSSRIESEETLANFRGP